MIEESDPWIMRVIKYRGEEPITTILSKVVQPRYVLDNSIETELRGYYIFLQNSEERPKSIRGPADYETALRVFDEVQTIKDRVSEILLVYTRITYDLDRMWDICKTHIILKPEVASAKSDTVRMAVIAKTVPELEDLLAKTKSNVASAELLTKNLNKTYEVLATQVDTIKQMMYWRSLALPNEKPSTTRTKIEL